MSVTLLAGSGSIAEITIHIVGATNSKGGNGGKEDGEYGKLIYVSFRKSTHPPLECETNKFQAKRGASVRLKSNLTRSLIINQSARREAENQIVANRITWNITSVIIFPLWLFLKFGDKYLLKSSIYKFNEKK